MLQLYRLTNTDITDVQNEMRALEDAIKEYELILSNDDELKKVVKDELRKVKKEFAYPRKTEILRPAAAARFKNGKGGPTVGVIILIAFLRSIPVTAIGKILPLPSVNCIRRE